MTKFIKALKGNVAAAGKYFPTNVSIPVDDAIAQNDEFKDMTKKGLLMIFSTLEAANRYRVVANSSTS